MEIALILGALFIFCTMAFLAVAFFLPEWVGIQGKKAQEIEEAHRGDHSSRQDPVVSNRQDHTDSKHQAPTNDKPKT